MRARCPRRFSMNGRTMGVLKKTKRSSGPSPEPCEEVYENRSGSHYCGNLAERVTTSPVVVWACLLWAGWTVLFTADAHSLLQAHAGTPAGLVERIYFSGSTMFTLGNGDFTPQGRLWQLATSAATLSGLFLLTLSVT